jgi:hypothetical protein
VNGTRRRSAVFLRLSFGKLSLGMGDGRVPRKRVGKKRFEYEGKD